MTWQRAKQYCSNREAHLVNASSIGEYDYITTEVLLTSNKAERIWIAVNDRKIEGNFVGSEGKSRAFFNWDGDEPNQRGNQDCMEIGVDLNGKWNHLSCYAKRSFVCEKR